MFLTCKCLNVSIKSRGELQKVNVDDFDLTTNERSDGFFQQDIATISELEGINKEQPGLIEIRNFGSWIIHRCRNCGLYTHAVHKEHGAALVLINTNMISSSEEIERLKLSTDYSTIFRIIIDHNSLEDFDHLQPSKFSVSQLSSSVQVALVSLQQQLEQAVQRQIIEVEEKIRAFTQEQYQLLEEFREKAHDEHRLLTRLICGRSEIDKLPNSIETTPVKPGGFREAPNTTVSSTCNAMSNPTAEKKNDNVKKKGPLSLPKNDSYSYDTEALFSLEGMDDTAVDHHQPSEEESDTDDSGHDEGIHMPRGQRGGHPTLAKSLPVSVPTFPLLVRRTIQDQDGDQHPRDPLDPHNIRASIKALAKSVHGDTVFGDLPRPRFSTQI
ncbi:uncharacterized protein PRAS40 isoform X2 [Prorops nasuta]|uniref:uncharacterized protein PRAS40 isoform X2 n=1 Tax=Prorops nasuta TaxID=863751 RepID=UPI0034CE7606